MTEPKVIPLAEPVLGGNARRYLDECLETNFVSSVGPFVDRFERDIAAYVGHRYAVACASGTAAIHVALRLLGVDRDDEVFVSTLTFIASANPIVYQGARPVFFDADDTTWNLDPALVVGEFERRSRAGLPMPRAVEVVHILGHPVDIEPIVDACERFGIPLIEDAAESLGARYVSGRFEGRRVGSLGQVGCFSFNGNKTITTGGGGMITTDDESLARRAKHLTTQARLPGVEYRHDEIGYNYRLTNLAAALGVAQLEKLPEFLDAKSQIARTYDRALAKLPGVTTPPRARWAEPSYWLYTIAIDPEAAGFDRVEALEHLASHGVQSRPIWPPLHTMPVYRGATYVGGGVGERLFARCLSLPSTPNLSRDDQARVIDALNELSRTRRPRGA